MTGEFLSETPDACKPRTRGPKQRPVVDLDSTRPVDYTDYTFAKGWSPSKARRRKPHLPIITVEGFPDQVIPAVAEAIQRGERPTLPAPPLLKPRRRGRGRPPKAPQP
jgi:hypothetical protein